MKCKCGEKTSADITVDGARLVVWKCEPDTLRNVTNDKPYRCPKCEQK